MNKRPIQSANVVRLNSGALETVTDAVVVEEPLEIRIGETSLAVTMRTPGHDEELAAGFLYTEGIISSPSDLADVRHCNAEQAGEHAGNIVVVTLALGVKFDAAQCTRHFYATSSCGVCGKASIEQIRQRIEPISSAIRVPPALITSLPDKMRSAQRVFGDTGGLHAAALFDLDGNLKCLREDVGRHNAVDKVIGSAVLHQELPLDNHVLLVSGRAGFEIVQKACIAGVPILAAVSAPSSLAVELALESNMTLIGFLRGAEMNIYAGSDRIA